MTETVPGYPIERPPACPFDPPPALTELRETRPLSRMTYADGHLGWVVTSHALARAVLADQRFSARAELRHPPFEGLPAAAGPAAPGMFTAMDPPDHTRYRRLLTREFTVRRMRRLTERIHTIAAERLDALEQAGPPADLVRDWAQPIPAQVICEILGVPYADRGRFQEQALKLFRLDLPADELGAAYMSVRGYVGELVTEKRARPADDLLSGLTATGLTDDELINIGFTLLGAGLDTTANMLGLGVLALLRDPEQLAALRDDPGLADRAVEELLRYLSIIPGTVRTALEDAELDGETIKAGESVTVAIPAANRDPAHFADPDALDLHRHTHGHLAFGHGIHQCLGQQLARSELQVALPALVTRFPTLRLAIPYDEVPLRNDMLIFGVHELPVTWS